MGKLHVHKRQLILPGLNKVVANKSHKGLGATEAEQKVGCLDLLITDGSLALS